LHRWHRRNITVVVKNGAIRRLNESVETGGNLIYGHIPIEPFKLELGNQPPKRVVQECPSIKEPVILVDKFVFGIRHGQSGSFAQSVPVIVNGPFDEIRKFGKLFLKELLGSLLYIFPDNLGRWLITEVLSGTILNAAFKDPAGQNNQAPRLMREFWSIHRTLREYHHNVFRGYSVGIPGNRVNGGSILGRSRTLFRGGCLD